MNYLAHSVLSFGNENILVGNFIADHVRRVEFESIDKEIKKGVTLHRKIDYFTDTHPMFIKSKRYFYEEFERYSGVLADIYYDHILATNFAKYSQVKLNDFAKSVYQVLDKNIQHLPESSRQFLHYVKKHNTFIEYSKLNGIELVLRHLSLRINHGVDLSKSINYFVANKEKMEEDFFIFMKDVMEFSKKELAQYQSVSHY